MSEDNWFAVSNVAAILALIATILSHRASRAVRLVCWLSACAWASLLLIDGFFRLSLLPGTWELTGVGLLAWMIVVGWHSRLFTRTPKAV